MEVRKSWFLPCFASWVGRECEASRRTRTPLPHNTAHYSFRLRFSKRRHPRVAARNVVPRRRVVPSLAHRARHSAMRHHVRARSNKETMENKGGAAMFPVQRIGRARIRTGRASRRVQTKRRAARRSATHNATQETSHNGKRGLARSLYRL